MRLGISVARPNLISLGTCFGRFSKSGKFKLHITALDYVAQYAKYKVCYATVSYHVSHSNVSLGVDQTERRDALPVRESCRQGSPGTYHGGYA